MWLINSYLGVPGGAKGQCQTIFTLNAGSYHKYRIALNFRGAQFSRFSRIWENRKICAPQKFSQNCYKVLLVALGGPHWLFG